MKYNHVCSLRQTGFVSAQDVTSVRQPVCIQLSNCWRSVIVKGNMQIFHLNIGPVCLRVCTPVGLEAGFGKFGT